MSRVQRCGWIALAVWAIPTGMGFAQEEPNPRDPTPVLTSRAGEPESTPPTAPSQSVGSPDRGRLRRGVRLTEDDYLFIRPTRRRPAVYGVQELVDLITRTARAVVSAHPGPKLVVGDLSARRGGRLRPHRSHRSGRDVDIGWFLVDPENGDAPIQPPRFVQLFRNGCGRIGSQRYCFDAARNWAMVAAIAAPENRARVQYILVAQDLRRRLLTEGERQGAPSELIERVRVMTSPHSGSASHRSHIHVRIYCPLDDRPDCVDEPPYHDWYEGTPSPGARAAVRRRARARARHARRQRARRRRARQRARQRARRRSSAGTTGRRGRGSGSTGSRGRRARGGTRRGGTRRGGTQGSRRRRRADSQ